MIAPIRRPIRAATLQNQSEVALPQGLRILRQAQFPEGEKVVPNAQTLNTSMFAVHEIVYGIDAPLAQFLSYLTKIFENDHFALAVSGPHRGSPRISYTTRNKPPELWNCLLECGQPVLDAHIKEADVAISSGGFVFPTHRTRFRPV
jgi:hypothetical protein